MKGVPFVNRRYMKEAPCLSKMVYKRVRGWTLVGAFPYKTLVSTPMVMGHSSNQLLLASFSCFKTMRVNNNNNNYYCYIFPLQDLSELFIIHNKKKQSNFPLCKEALFCEGEGKGGLCLLSLDLKTCCFTY